MKYLIIIIILINLIIANDEKDSKIKYPIEVIDIYFKNIPFKIKQILNCSENLKNIFLLRENGNIFFSEDYGSNWDDLKDSFSLPHQKNAFKIEEIYQNPKDDKHLIFIEDNLSYFETLNCDKNIKPILNGNRLQDLLIHPNNKNYILVNYYENCENKKNCNEKWILKLSKDQGNTWENLKTDVIEFCWSKFSEDSFDSPNFRIFYIISSFKSKILYYTDDFFKTSINIFTNVNSLELTKNFIFIDTNKKFSKYVSDALGDLYTFYPIKFDKINNNKFKTKIISSEYKNLIYIIVVSKSNGLEISGLYYSDYWGINYQNLLDYIVCNYRTLNCDIHIVKSIEGVIIANIYDEKIITSLMNISNKDNSLYYLENYENLFKRVKTVISYDYGKTWNYIKNPLQNSNNKLFNCVDCSLNLFIWHNNKNLNKEGIISQKFSPGIIIAQGSVGKYLFDSKNSLGVYLSEDGGLNWKEILQGEYIFSMIDQGGFILAAVQNLKTNTIKISSDYGNNWLDIKISEKFIYINKIVVDSLEKENKFLIIGKKFKKSEEDYIITIDLKNFHENNCQYFENTEISDYEIFTPFNIGGKNNCYNGRIINFLRKKKDRNCYNKEQKNLYIIKDLCKCTEEDWNCNYGFTRDNNKKCVLITSQNMDPNMFISNFEGFKKTEKENYCINGLYKKNPYVKNIKSYCVNGVDYGNKFLPCKKRFNFLPIIFYLILILIIFFIIIAIKNYIPKKNFTKILRIFKKNNYHDNNDDYKNNNENIYEFESKIINREDNIFNNDKLFESNT